MNGLDKKAFGRNIRQARCRLGLTQEQMAELLDMAPEVYGRMERGLILPRLERFVAICRALGESPDRLISQPGREEEEEDVIQVIQAEAASSIKSFRESLAENLRESRKKMGWTQAEMAKRINMTVSSYGRMERAVLLPTLEGFVLICCVLGEMSDHMLGLPPPEQRAKR
jgi:transcriptional regulator with XRE-family HTH domain